jgi:hypothetical protein
MCGGVGRGRRAEGGGASVVGAELEGEVHRYLKDKNGAGTGANRAGKGGVPWKAWYRVIWGQR